MATGKVEVEIFKGQKCLNESCDNRVGEGGFATVIIKAPGKMNMPEREIKLFPICQPCADVIVIAIEGGK